MNPDLGIGCRIDERGNAHYSLPWLKNMEWSKKGEAPPKSESGQSYNRAWNQSGASPINPSPNTEYPTNRNLDVNKSSDSGFGFFVLALLGLAYLGSRSGSSPKETRQTEPIPVYIPPFHSSRDQLEDRIRGSGEEVLYDSARGSSRRGGIVTDLRDSSTYSAGISGGGQIKRGKDFVEVHGVDSKGIFRTVHIPREHARIELED